MALETVEFILGEKKEISIEVHSVYNEVFNVTSGSFCLTDSDGATAVDVTATLYIETIDNEEICKEIYYTLDTTGMDLGKYTGVFTYVVNGEILKYKFIVSIVE